MIKKTTRIIKEDGTEAVRVQFILNERYVQDYVRRKEREEKLKRDAAQRAALEEK